MKQRLTLVVTMAALMLADFTSGFETSMLYTALPAIARETGGIVSGGWLISIFLLAQATSAAIGGRLGDMFGRRKILIVALICCAAGSVLSATADDMFLIIVGRAIQGVSGAILPLCFGIIRATMDESRVPLLIGIMAGCYAFGGILGYAAGGAVVDQYGWRAIFILTAMLASLAVVTTRIFVPAGVASTAGKRFDIIGGVLFAPSIGAIMVGVTMGPKWGWLSAGPWFLIVGGIAVLALWALYEWRRESPLIDVRLLTNRQILIANIIYATLGLGATQAPVVVMMMVQQSPLTGIGLGMTAAMAGLFKMPTSVAAAIGAPSGGWMVGKFGAKLNAILGTSLIVAAWTGLLFVHTTAWEILALISLNSLGTGILWAAVPALVVEISPVERTSETTGLIMVMRNIGMAVGAQIIILVLAMSQVSDPAGKLVPAPEAYSYAIIAIIVISLFGLAAALFLPKAVGQMQKTAPALAE